MMALKSRLQVMSKLRLVELIGLNVLSCCASYFLVKGQFDYGFWKLVFAITTAIAIVCIVYGISEYIEWRKRKTENVWYDNLTLMIAPLIFALLMRVFDSFYIVPLTL